jgi:phytoene synthase
MTMRGMTGLVRRYDPDRFLACLFAPADRREALLLLCAFNHELARAREVASNPVLALIRLQWWREVVEGARRRHEVAGPLGDALESGALSAADLLAMIEAREIEAEEGVPDLAAWLGYLSGSAGGLAVAAGRVLGAVALDLARLRALGAAYGVAGQLRSVAVLARQGRCLLPADVLGAHGLTADHVIQAPERAAPALAALAEEGAVLLRAGQGRFARTVIAAGLPAVLARRDLRRPPLFHAGPRGLGDKFAVVQAAALGRI